MRKYSAIVFVLLLSLICYPALQVSAQSAKDILRTSRMKAKVESQGPRTTVIVDCINGDTVKGDISLITADGFSVTDRKTGAVTSISFDEVKAVHKKVSNAMLAAEIAGAAGTAVGLLYFTAFALSKCSPCIGR